MPLARGTKRPADPYEFDDDPNAPVHMDGLKSEADEPGGPKAKADSLFTTQGLQPKLADLENMFDDHEWDAEEPAVPTPPGSNKPKGGGLGDDPAAVSGKLHAKTVLPAATTMLNTIELSKIYPTPPSHEHNHNPSASPVCHYEGAPTDADPAALAIFKMERGEDGPPPPPPPPPPPERVVRMGNLWIEKWIGLKICWLISVTNF